MAAANKAGQPRGKGARLRSVSQPPLHPPRTLPCATSITSKRRTSILPPFRCISVQERALDTKPTQSCMATAGTPISTVAIRGLPTIIPFVTPASPFVSPQHQIHPQSTGSSSRSPFSPSPTHSTSASPHGMVAPDLAPPVHPLQVVQTHILEHSRPSQQSSPQQSPLHHPSSSPSHHNPHSTYFPYPAQLRLDDLQQPIAQARPPHHTSPQSLPTMEGLDWSINQNYPFQSLDVAASWQRQQQQQQLTNTTHSRQIHHPQQQVLTTRRFPSTHRHSPNQQPMAGPSNHLQASLANDLSRESTDPRMRAHVENQTPAYSDLANTNTAQSHALNLDASPSWNSAMTQMQMVEYDHFYQAQQDQLHDQLPPLDSAHQHLPSHSSIGLQSHYSQELSRQQLQQLRQQHLRLEQARRHSLAGEYLQQHYGGTLHPHPQQQHSQQHNFFNEEPSRLHLYQTHRGAHDPTQAPLPSSPLLDPSAYTQARHLHPQMQRHHPHYIVEENHNMKYDPPSLQRTPPLRLE
ncbi:hypothetical protein JVT61DRAFT_2631 [Boletus reticuloceps]|uniref:Uncharacterized protein n=1 Tax=Boletus reticuloceps TaxID=495285 RepID=A0A8I3A8I6_9AGAM|nr:hypothetical protein JVT61DRAFT_2631 [Boletus reticuloceps]